MSKTIHDAQNDPRQARLDREFEEAAHALLATTEEMCTAIAEEGLGGDAAHSTFMRREANFENLRRCAERGGAASAGALDCLARIRALDAHLIEVGREVAAALRVEIHGAQRRRSAIQKHAVRERSEPRLFTQRA